LALLRDRPIIQKSVLFQIFAPFLTSEWVTHRLNFERLDLDPEIGGKGWPEGQTRKIAMFGQLFKIVFSREFYGLAGNVKSSRNRTRNTRKTCSCQWKTKLRVARGSCGAEAPPPPSAQ